MTPRQLPGQMDLDCMTNLFELELMNFIWSETEIWAVNPIEAVSYK